MIENRQSPFNELERIVRGESPEGCRNLIVILLVGLAGGVFAIRAFFPDFQPPPQLGGATLTPTRVALAATPTPTQLPAPTNTSAPTATPTRVPPTATPTPAPRTFSAVYCIEDYSTSLGKGFSCLRFFLDGTVLENSIDPSPNIQAAWNFLKDKMVPGNPDNAKGTYTLIGNQIELTTVKSAPEVNVTRTNQYQGHLVGDIFTMLRLKQIFKRGDAFDERILDLTGKGGMMVPPQYEERNKP